MTADFVPHGKLAGLEILDAGNLPVVELDGFIFEAYPAREAASG